MMAVGYAVDSHSWLPAPDRLSQTFHIDPSLPELPGLIAFKLRVTRTRSLICFSRG